MIVWAVERGHKDLVEYFISKVPYGKRPMNGMLDYIWQDEKDIKIY